jgi:hypothetical protein
MVVGGSYPHKIINICLMQGSSGIWPGTKISEAAIKIRDINGR